MVLFWKIDCKRSVPVENRDSVYCLIIPSHVIPCNVVADETGDNIQVGPAPGDAYESDRFVAGRIDVDCLEPFGKLIRNFPRI